MQSLGLRRGLRWQHPSGSALRNTARCPPRPLPGCSGLLRCPRLRGASGEGSGAPSAGEPSPVPHNGASPNAGSSPEQQPATAPAAATNPTAPSPSASAAPGEASVSPTAHHDGASPSSTIATPAPSNADAPSPAASPSPSPPSSSAPATSPLSSLAAGTSLPPFAQQLLSWLAAVWAALRQFPAWVQMQHLRRLREACEEDPKDASKHAAYLAELVRSNPREVVSRVESRRFPVNGAVAAEYLKALIATGRVAELAKADGAEAAEAAAAATSGSGAGGAELPPPRTLGELLRDLQDQLAPPAGEGAAGGGVGASLEAPGSSLRRPLHVVVAGGLPGGAQAGAPAPSRPAPLLLRPFALLWRLMSSAVVLMLLAFAYIAGSQAIRRVQASGGALVFPTAVGAGPAVSAAAGGGGGAAGAAATPGGGGGGPGVEPKEYKKDELPEKSIRTFKDVKGCDEAKEELREVVEFLKHPTKFTRLGAKLPKGVLLTGPPGTGKTLLAKAVAGEAGVPFFYRAGSEFEELYVGVGSRRMRALFAAAKKRSPCIVFIDEIDAIGGNRKHWENHTRKTLNQLLVEMDGFEASEGIIVMAATNLAESLDPALKRPGRFDRQVAVPLPDIQGRRDILEYYLGDKPIEPDVDRELLARQSQGFSGADLSNLVNEAAILAAKEGRDAISQRMLEWAFDKVLMGVERKSVQRSLEARRHTAYHEAGHALVAMCTPGASPVHKATIVPRGHALGMVTQVGREDEFSINRQQMTARIRVCLGGTVAEELVFGAEQVSSGATDDLRQATSLARHMVSQCGMSPAIGPVYLAGGDAVSEETRRAVDGEVAAMLGAAKQDVRAMLSERMQDLHTLAAALLDKETLTREEISALLQHDPAAPPPASSSGSGGGGGGTGGGGEERRPEDEPAPAPVAAATAGMVPAPAVGTANGLCSTSYEPSGPVRAGMREVGTQTAAGANVAAAAAGVREDGAVAGPLSSTAAAERTAGITGSSYSRYSSTAEYGLGSQRRQGSRESGMIGTGGWESSRRVRLEESLSEEAEAEGRGLSVAERFMSEGDEGREETGAGDALSSEP